RATPAGAVTLAVSVTGEPCATAVVLTVRPTPVGIAVTTCVNDPLDGRNPTAGVYSAVIECDPTASPEVVSAACCWPPTFPSANVPRTVPPSLNVTDPCGVAPVAATVAVNVTACVRNAGDALVWSVIVVPTWIVWPTAFDVDGLYAVAPPYWAVTVCAPAASVEVVSVATPPLSGPPPAGFPSTRNVTVPVGVPVAADTAAVNVTGWPS